VDGVCLFVVLKILGEFFDVHGWVSSAVGEGRDQRACERLNAEMSPVIPALNGRVVAIRPVLLQLG